MTADKETIVRILVEILGDPKHVGKDKGQYSFNCPVCDEGRNKGNLEVNINKNVFHCWSCDANSDSDNNKGTLGKLIRLHGSSSQLKLYRVFGGFAHYEDKPKEVVVELPEGFVPWDKLINIYPPHMQAIKYIKSRGVTDEMIKKHQLGVTTKGRFANRIIFPSYDKEKKLNYFVGRTWGLAKPKYLDVDAPKTSIIFNEHLIDWEKDIFIVEGPFDSLFLDNCITTLGSELHRNLLEAIYNNSKGNLIIAYDPDAQNKAKKIYHELNGGRLWGKIKMLSLPENEDVASLRGDVMQFLYEIK